MYLTACTLQKTNNSIYGNKNNTFNRYNQKQLDFQQQTAFLVPPNTINEKSIMIKKVLDQGVWSRAFALSQSISYWSLLPMIKRFSLLSLIENNMKKVAIESHFSYASVVYDS